MTIHTHKKLPNVQGVGANQTFTVGLPTGAKEYMLLGLDMSGTTFAKTDISNLELLVNSSPIMQFKTVAHLEKISAYYGLNVNSNEVVVPFFLEWMNDALMGGKFNLGVGDVDVLQLRGDIGAGADAPLINAWSKETQRAAMAGEGIAAANRLGVFRKVKNYTYSLTGEGETEIDNIPRQEILMALHLFQSSDVITNVEVWADDTKIWDASASRMGRIVERAGRTKQAASYHIDFMLENELGTAMVIAGLRDFRLKVAHSGSATVVLYSELMSGSAG